MKSCPYCAEQIQDAAVKCRHCGEVVNTAPEPQRSKLAYLPLFVLLTIVGIAVYGLAASAAYEADGYASAFKVIALLIPCLVLSPFAWMLANAFREVATPSAFFAKGMVDIFLKKLGFTFGPFIVSMAVVYGGVLVLADHLGWISLSSPKIEEPTVASTSDGRSAPVMPSRTSTQSGSSTSSPPKPNPRTAPPKPQLASSSFAQPSAPPTEAAPAPPVATTAGAQRVEFTREQEQTPECELAFADADGVVNDNGMIWTLPSGETIYMGKSCDLQSKKFGRGLWGWSNAGFRLQFQACHLSSTPLAEPPIETSDCEIGRSADGTALHLPAEVGARLAGQPSFDCSAIETRVEKTICDSPQLANADSTIARLYEDARSQGQTTTREQIEWLKRRNACQTSDCLAASEAERIHQLRTESH